MIPLDRIRAKLDLGDVDLELKYQVERLLIRWGEIEDVLNKSERRDIAELEVLRAIIRRP